MLRRRNRAVLTAINQARPAYPCGVTSVTDAALAVIPIRSLPANRRGPVSTANSA
jgi:hypothetical protein